MRNLETIIEQLQRKISALETSNKDLARRVEQLELRPSRHSSETIVTSDRPQQQNRPKF
jgi:hypothetical protein